MKQNGEKDSDGLMRLVKSVKLRKSVIKRRLEAGRTIQIDLDSKAQLLTIISKSEGQDTLNHSLIIEDGRTPKIVLIADPFAPHILMYVSIVEKD